MNEEYHSKLKKFHQSWVQDYRIYLIKFVNENVSFIIPEWIEE